MKLLLVILSLVVIYKGVLDSGDPGGFYSSTTVFYAMLLLDYYTQKEIFKDKFLIFARVIMMILSGISVAGVLGVFTIIEQNNQYFIAFSSTMRLTESGLINVHWAFLGMTIISILMASLEWLNKIGLEASTGGKAIRNRKKVV